MSEKILKALQSLIADNKELSARIENVENQKPKNGKDAPALESIVEAVLAEIPMAKDGISPDENEIIKRCIAAIPKPRDGRDAALPSVSDIAAILLPKIPRPENGKDGVSPDPKAIAENVREMVKDGEQGAQGAQGMQGEQGPKGDRGDQGPKGEKGEKGDSLTEIKVERTGDVFAVIAGKKHRAGKIDMRAAAPRLVGGGGGKRKGAGGDLALIYDKVVDLESQVLSENPASFLGQTWWARDTKLAYKAVNSQLNTAEDIWQAIGTVYDESTDTFHLPATRDGQTQNLGQELFFNAYNEGAAATALNPKVFLSIGAYVGNNDFKSSVRPASPADVSAGSLIGINTTDAGNGETFKLVMLGDIRGVNTSAWSVNSILYIADNGGLTNVQPPVNAIAVAVVTKVGATDGAIFATTISPERIDREAVPVGFQRNYFTGEQVTLAAGTFYKALQGTKGTVQLATQTVVVPDDSIVAAPIDHITDQAPAQQTIQTGLYEGLMQTQINQPGAAERISVELYLADADGNPVDSGSGLPAGDLGQPPIVVLVGPLTDHDANDIFYDMLSGFVQTEVEVSAGQRIRAHTLCEKVGTAGGDKTFTLSYGQDAATYFDSPQRFSVSDIDGLPGALNSILNIQLLDITAGRSNVLFCEEYPDLNAVFMGTEDEIFKLEGTNISSSAQFSGRSFTAGAVFQGVAIAGTDNGATIYNTTNLTNWNNVFNSGGNAVGAFCQYNDGADQILVALSNDGSTAKCVKSNNPSFSGVTDVLSPANATALGITDFHDAETSVDDGAVLLATNAGVIRAAVPAPNNWSNVDAQQCTALLSTPGLFVAGYSNGDIKTSSDGITWLFAVNIGTKVTKIVEFGGLFYAVGDTNSIFRGSDPALIVPVHKSNQGGFNDISEHLGGLVFASIENGALMYFGGENCWDETAVQTIQQGIQFGGQQLTFGGSNVVSLVAGNGISIAGNGNQIEINQE